MQVISYGASATVNIYTGGGATPRITYTGNVVAGTATSLDSLILKGSGAFSSISEIIVSDSDTRNLTLATLAPNAAGDANQWTGTYTNVNTTTYNDTSVISDATSGDVFQCKMNALSTSSLSVVAVKVAARMTKTGTGVASVAVGVKTNATVSVPAATAQAATWGTTETYYPLNPVTAAAWTPAQINLLQIHLQSAP